jgi:hypothetical protein
MGRYSSVAPAPLWVVLELHPLSVGFTISPAGGS